MDMLSTDLKNKTHCQCRVSKPRSFFQCGNHPRPQPVVRKCDGGVLCMQSCTAYSKPVRRTNKASRFVAFTSKSRQLPEYIRLIYRVHGPYDLGLTNSSYMHRNSSFLAYRLPHQDFRIYVLYKGNANCPLSLFFSRRDLRARENAAQNLGKPPQHSCRIKTNTPILKSSTSSSSSSFSSFLSCSVRVRTTKAITQPPKLSTTENN